MNYNELLQYLEEKRKKILMISFICIGVSIFVTLFAFLILKNESSAIFLVSSIVISGFIIYRNAKQYKKYFKNHMMPLIIEKTGMILQYEPKRGIEQHMALGSKLFKRPDRYHCEDLMYGTIDGVNFFSSDVTMDERRVTTDSKGNTRTEYIPIFKGRWFIYDFNKEFNGIIQVREGRFSSHPWGLKVERIKLEDVSFNKKFKTYATNQHDAFYVLTPSLVENMKKIERRFPGKIYFSFIGTQLHIAIYNSKDHFEPPYFKSVNDEFITSQVEEILLLKEVMEELRLNRKIFK